MVAVDVKLPEIGVDGESSERVEEEAWPGLICGERLALVGEDSDLAQPLASRPTTADDPLPSRSRLDVQCHAAASCTSVFASTGHTPRPDMLKCTWETARLLSRSCADKLCG